MEKSVFAPITIIRSCELGDPPVYLVDTSVWIDFFRIRKNAAVARLEEIFEYGQPFGITGVVYQEVLQGADSWKDFSMLETYFSTQHFYHPLNSSQSFRNAAELYFRCRRKGVTIRSTIDCLIAQIAIEQDLFLLHHDSDFTAMKKAIPELKLAV